MELRHLRYFVTLAEELHFGKAAERLHIAQPPLSQQIRQLEIELGFDLFHRTKRTVRLTEAGQVFLGEVQQILQQLQQAIQLGQTSSRGEVGQLIVGFVSSAAYNILPIILRNFRACTPAVKLELHEMTTDQQLEWLREGGIDIGFIRPPVEENIFNWETIFQESLMVALPETHLLANQFNIPLTSLGNESFILFPRKIAPGLYDLIISLCQQAGFSPHVAQEAIQMQTTVSLVAADMGIAIVPASLQNLQRTGVVYKNIQEATAKVALAMTWRKNETSPTLQRFLHTVRALRECF
ncbi:transcriptional regulator, LysR family [Trichormus variabilis ATCC 29413]|uniref:Transcriptional regulator, LysR family n=2 Tax=Anabaena variabilis TaxID=264691 RepID=Q3MEY8_TRIV2|nr:MULTISPECIES: LysR family transcriptional regulator [Nostocaceae]ABA20448.1 transcriptional regulator, LysR family [Trichormus variabilis ATCC 29413]MBC1216635.1 LysR family transcriptional regulator [Trichormus variabilis ARAD]MBC1258169.1 LysR family transcriptional regulator [Trichormus variabilis V5]MBC1269319.1 LysR family transcriptional regulator [Trichormus variabilis FSR]MBC1304908.1 LysR family transcriptional regulator [Trichormus variabilis N2B]